MSDTPYKFLVDRMLGRLIAWLRILGYDTEGALGQEAAPDEDTALIEEAKKEGRILVSRDRALVDRARKAGVEAVMENSDDVKAQLKELIERYGLNTSPDMTRCTACNSLLREAGTEKDMEKIRSSGEVPERLIQDHARLWICDKCGKVYWQGSHWRNIRKMADELKMPQN